jgi:hypothetical protein
MEQQYDNREFMIFNTSELPLINFNEVLETSEETVRRSINGEKTFVKWDGEIPSSVLSLTTSEGPYTYDEILEILSTSEWVNYDNNIIDEF